MHPSNKAWAWVVFENDVTLFGAKSAHSHNYILPKSTPQNPVKIHLHFTSTWNETFKQSNPIIFLSLFVTEMSQLPFHFSHPLTTNSKKLHSCEGRIPGPVPAKMYAGWTAPSRFPSVANCPRTAKGLSLLKRFSFLKTKTSCKVQPKGGNQPLEGFWMKKNPVTWCN